MEHAPEAVVCGYVTGPYRALPMTGRAPATPRHRGRARAPIAGPAAAGLALLVHLAAAAFIFASSPELHRRSAAAAEELAPVRRAPWPVQDVPAVGLGDEARSFVYAITMPLRGVAGCRSATDGPAVFDGAGLLRAPPSPSEREDARSRLERAASACVQDGGAEGARASVTVNRLRGGGYTTAVVPLNDAARDRDLLCCLKAAQDGVAEALRPGETARYRVAMREEVTFTPDPFVQ